MSTLMQKIVAEFVGTFVYTFCACGCSAGTFGNTLATAHAFGFTIMAMYYSIGRVSGCHINPAVSLAFFILGQLSCTEFLLYLISQIIGGLIGALIIFAFLYMSMPSPRTDNILINYGDATNNIIFYSIKGYEAGSTFGGLLTEIILSFIFIYVIINAVEPGNPYRNMAGFIIGGTLIMIHLVGMSITGTSVNPARSLATAVSQVTYFDKHDSIEQIWIWILGPMIGGLLAPFFYLFLHGDNLKNTNVKVPANSEDVRPVGNVSTESIKKNIE